jgi:two-component system sensor histidine kinase HydH
MQAPETCRLSEVVSAAIDADAGVAEEQGVKVSASIDPSIELPLERARMERVFLNLITNALEAMPGGGRVDICAERNGNGVVVNVDDTGPGIPASVRQRLFEPFVTSRKAGLGLGLALSRQTVLEHGGDLWVEDGKGGGAHFRLRLPL